VVRAAEASVQEATAVWESATALDKEAEDQAALAEMEAWERVSRMGVENVVVLASTHGRMRCSLRGLPFLRL
jgi:hypothetical protein